jgi:DNA/RNA endonuclease YhcR with UshA esterase domain
MNGTVSRALVTLALLCACRFVAAEDAPTTSPATTEPAAVIGAADKDALAAHMNNEVTVEGVVADAKWSASGKVFIIKFKDAETSQFQAAVFSKNKDAMEKAFDGDLTKALEGAKLLVKGKLQTFREHPEIMVDKPEQITVVEKPAAK